MQIIRAILATRDAKRYVKIEHIPPGWMRVFNLQRGLPDVAWGSRTEPVSAAIKERKNVHVTHPRKPGKHRGSEFHRVKYVSPDFEH